MFNKKKINLKQLIQSMRIQKERLTIQIFHFNPIQVNTLVAYDDSKEAVIIDPGNSTPAEDQKLADYIAQNQLTVKMVINTHPHIDHVVGNQFCVEYFKAPLCAHPAGEPIYKHSPGYGFTFGFMQTKYPPIDLELTDNQIIRWGNQEWKVLETFGHADGSVCFYDERNQLVIVGDVLFEGGIGRTDLPTGNYQLLLHNIHTQLLSLPDETLVIPGHAGTTTIGEEKRSNPFL